jgi:hypothetical protein
VTAGAIVPVKFTLAGAGASLLIDSQAVDCTTLVPTGETPTTLVGPGSTDLSQNGDEYHVNWKTDAAWARRSILVSVSAGARDRANRDVTESVRQGFAPILDERGEDEVEPTRVEVRLKTCRAARRRPKAE